MKLLTADGEGRERAARAEPLRSHAGVAANACFFVEWTGRGPCWPLAPFPSVTRCFIASFHFVGSHCVTGSALYTCSRAPNFARQISPPVCASGMVGFDR